MGDNANTCNTVGDTIKIDHTLGAGKIVYWCQDVCDNKIYCQM